MIWLAAPSHPQVFDRGAPQILAFGLPIARCYQQLSTPICLKAFGKAPATSPKPPVFEYGTASADKTATRKPTFPIYQMCR